jgi:hypothetical protein
VPFHEPGLDELLRKNLAAGRLRFTTSIEDAAAFGDIHFVCVGTPQRADSMAADLSYVEDVVVALAPHLHRKALIVGKSTVPVGTAEWVEQLVERHAPETSAVEVAWSPEFLQEGHALEDVLRPNRVIFGVRSDWANAMLFAAHKGVFDLAATEDREVPVVVTNFATAELVKVAANAFLATKISFINAMAEICEPSGADVTMLARAIGYDARIGNKFLRAGVGFGGGCLPKDIRRSRRGRRNSASARRCASCTRSTSSTSAAGSGSCSWRPNCWDARSARPARTCPTCGWRCSARRSSRRPTTSVTPPRCRWCASSAAAAPTCPSTTPRGWRTPGARCPTSRTPDRRSRPSTGPTWCAC